MPFRFWRILKRSLAHAHQVLENSEEELGPCPSCIGEFSGEAWPMPLRFWRILRRSLAHAHQVLENSEEELGPCRQV